MTILVNGVFDDAPLAALGTPVVRGAGPGDPGVSAVDVVGADPADVLAALTAQGAAIVDAASPPVVAPTNPVPSITQMAQTVQQGSIGVRGERGEVGPVGPKGERGATGFTGPKGDRGPVGSVASTPSSPVRHRPWLSLIRNIAPFVAIAIEVIRFIH